MKLVHLPLLFAAGILVSGPVLADEALAKAKGCLACHTVDKKLIGPTYKEVAQKYAGQPMTLMGMEFSSVERNLVGFEWQRLS